MTNESIRFSFGANWADYIKKHYSAERLAVASSHLKNFLKVDDLRSKSFLDIGCGSGIHSLAAYKLGATKILSFDYDPISVRTTEELWKSVGCPKNWIVERGSILDTEYLSKLGMFDVVYAWGCLHHTGSMWEAMKNTVTLIGKGGLLYIALYSKDVYVSPPYQYWLDVKRKYNQSYILNKKFMEMRYAWWNIVRPSIRRKKNPLRAIKEYSKSRGMSYWHDVRDWLGGYPMAFAGNLETVRFAEQEMELALLHIKAGEGNTEYLFSRAREETYFDVMKQNIPSLPISGPMTKREGYAWTMNIEGLSIGDPSKLMLYENGIPIGWPNAALDQIARWGRGRYRIDGGQLIFSTLENDLPSDKQYSFRADFL